MKILHFLFKLSTIVLIGIILFAVLFLLEEFESDFLLPILVLTIILILNFRCLIKTWNYRISKKDVYSNPLGNTVIDNLLVDEKTVKPKKKGILIVWFVITTILIFIVSLFAVSELTSPINPRYPNGVFNFEYELEFVVILIFIFLVQSVFGIVLMINRLSDKIK